MADILIKGMEMPGDGEMLCINIYPDGKVSISLDLTCAKIAQAVELPPHGRLIDADRLHESMYHRVFDIGDDTMWQSGCWVRYRAIEQVQDSAPTVIEASEVENG